MEDKPVLSTPHFCILPRYLLNVPSNMDFVSYTQFIVKLPRVQIFRPGYPRFITRYVPGYPNSAFADSMDIDVAYVGLRKIHDVKKKKSPNSLKRA